MSAVSSDVTVIPPGGGELIGDAPDRRVEILSDHDALHATWSRFGPRREGADLHVHRRHSDLFYVLDGELTLMLGTEGEEVPAAAGTLARVPPLVVHGFRNAGDADLSYLNFHAPGQGFASYMRALRDGRPIAYDQEPPPPAGARPATEAAVDAVRLRADGVVLHTDEEQIAVAELSREAAGESPHLHRRHAESLYVLEGELTVTAGGRELRAGAGSWIQLPECVAHRISPRDPSRWLSVHTPGCGFGAALGAPGGSGGPQPSAGFDQEPAP